VAEPAHDRIRLSAISATGYHGVFEHERRDGQPFVADVALHVDTRAAAADDRLDLTVHYGVLAEQVAAVLAGEPADLVETVAERIAAVALTYDAVQAVDVVVHKPQAPVSVPFGDVAVEIHRDREHLPSVPAPGFGAGDAGAEPAVPEPHGVPPAVPGPDDVTVPEAVHEAVDDRAPDEVLRAAPDAPVEVVLALGSNLGDSRAILRRAVWDLARVDGVEVTGIAPLARTAAVGGPEQGDFLNTVVLARTTLSPHDLLRACHGVEETHGRVRTERWGARTLDVDVVTYGSLVAADDTLVLPHPRAHERAFVLAPWAEVDQDAVLPGPDGGPVRALVERAPDRDGVRWMALDWWVAPPEPS
jgi:dihydroneopterin aldolase / 2-amino-4-hydroxy-6-hydroxymethyldihydropteridine diphosphokinase